MRVVSQETSTLLAISKIKGVGKKLINNIANNFSFQGKGVEEVISKIPSLQKHLSTISVEEIKEFASNQVKEAESSKHAIISQTDKQFPQYLRNIKNAPAFLFCAGDLSQLSKKSVAVIGTREPTEHGKIIAHNVTEWFCRNNWNIVSGLALGVDTLAHQASLENSIQSKTIAVLAQSLDKIYPAKNKDLAKKIIESGGLLVSEYPYFTRTFKSSFVERDRIQAALAYAVILVQSGMKGGSLHASRAILEFERPLVPLGQSLTDIANNEDKIQANLALLSGEKTAICNTLRINDFNPKLILNLLNKSLYKDIESKIFSINEKKYSSDNSQLLL